MTAPKGKVRETPRRELGPWGCYCKTLAKRVLGDGCDLCNPEYAKRFEAEPPK